MPFVDPQYISVVIIGGGQAGLSASYCLRQRGVDDHVILERHESGHSWRHGRWDSFRLITPNHQCRLPGFSYSGADPEGFMTREEVAAFVRDYERKFRPPILEGVTVTAVTKREGYFHLTTNQGTWFCDDVVIAIGGHHQPFIPKGADRLSDRICQIHSSEYRRPAQLPEGAVAVVGAGQSGVQIAEDLHRAGRQVHLCLGNAPRVPKVHRGKSAVTWLEEMGLHQGPAAIRDDAHDTDLRRLAVEGMRLHGFVEDIGLEKFTVSRDLGEKLDQADRFHDEICRRIDEHIVARGMELQDLEPPAPAWYPAEETGELDLAAHDIGGVVWCTGFQPDFRFVELPVFNMRGFPETERGVTDIPGLYFLGLPWMHGWGSARFAGIASDADHIAARIEASIAETAVCEP